LYFSLVNAPFCNIWNANNQQCHRLKKVVGQEIAIFEQTLQIFDRIPTDMYKFLTVVLKIWILPPNFPHIVLAPNFASFGLQFLYKKKIIRQPKI